MITIQVNGNKTAPDLIDVGTVGSYGETLSFTFSEEWAGLSKKVVFHPARRGHPVEILISSSGESTARIPAEVMRCSGFGKLILSGYELADGLIEEKIVTIPCILAIKAAPKPAGANLPDVPKVHEQLQYILDRHIDAFNKHLEDYILLNRKHESLQEGFGELLEDYNRHLEDYGVFVDSLSLQLTELIENGDESAEAIKALEIGLSHTDALVLENHNKLLDLEQEIADAAAKSGIHIGEEAPTDGSEVWIDTDEEAASGGASIDVTAEVGQTIVVKEVDENGKPTKWESADYQQRTHYENGTKANTLLNCNVPITNNQYAERGVLGFEDGQTYKVSWNGTEYVCVSVTVPYDRTTTAITIGNLGLMGGTNTGEPFLIAQLDNGFIAFASAANGTFSVKITEEVPSYKTIDEYYLPNRAKTYVLTANDYELNQAFIQDVEIESAHLANKLLDLLWNGYDILIDFSDISLSPPMVCQAKVLGWFYFENALELMFAVTSDTRRITIKGGTWTPPTT